MSEELKKRSLETIKRQRDDVVNFFAPKPTPFSNALADLFGVTDKPYLHESGDMRETNPPKRKEWHK